MADRIRRPTTRDLLTFAEYLSENVADAPGRMDELAEMLSRLPPTGGEILTRPSYERGTLWTMPVVFEGVAPGESPTPADIRITEDTWLRGMVGMSRWQINVNSDAIFDLDGQALAERLVNLSCPPGRAFFEVSWTINGKQGFVTNGSVEVEAFAGNVLGDGEYMVPLDWQLQQDDVISIAVRSRIDTFAPPDVPPEFVPPLYIWVAFWTEGLTRGPSQQ